MGLVVFVVWMILTSTVVGFDLGTPERVDVYPRGADVTWLLDAESDMTILVPASFSAERFSFHENDGLEVYQMTVTTESAGDWTPAALDSLVRQIDAKKQLLGELRADLAGIIQTLDYLRSGIDLGKLSNPLESIAEFRNLRVETEREKLELEAQEKQMSRQVMELQNTLRQWYSADIATVHRVNFSTNGVGSLEFTAFSRFAQWMPSYRASLNSNEQIVQLETNIAVQQQTGIDWNGLIVCHTAAPVDQVDVPFVRPLVARIQEELSVSGAQFAAPMAVRMESMDSAMPVPDPFDMQRVEGEAGIRLFGQGRVKTDGKRTLLSVGKDDLEVEVYATLIPYQQEMAWVLAETTQPAKALLRGSVDLIVDGSFTGTSTLEHPGGSQTLEIALGTSPLITAERNPIVYTERRTWLGRKVMVDGYEIDVYNGSSRDATIIVKDRVPVAGNDRINISVSMDPEPTAEEDGILSWTMAIPAGVQETIRVEYEISYPNNMNLIIR